MKYLLAVSGGVDSVVLLDLLVRENRHEIVVAHFDHGIRDDSASDARFVELLAAKYELLFESKREMLGPNASENLARKRRYRFLREAAKMHNATIVTAHHLDDLVETIAINFERGTGWRGLAVFGDETIFRPLLGKTKTELYKEALVRNLEWVEDETNASNQYLRNRLRKRTMRLENEIKTELARRRTQQIVLKTKIDAETAKINTNSRYFFTMLETATALEILRAKTKAKLTRPQLENLLLQIKTARPSKIWRAVTITARFSTREFTLEINSQR